MGKYEVFKALLEFVADEFEVTDADMNNYCGEIEICGKMGRHTIKITVRLDEEKEEVVEE